jgi:hypothetical protein
MGRKGEVLTAVCSVSLVITQLKRERGASEEGTAVEKKEEQTMIL